MCSTVSILTSIYYLFRSPFASSLTVCNMYLDWLLLTRRESSMPVPRTVTKNLSLIISYNFDVHFYCLAGIFIFKNPSIFFFQLKKYLDIKICTLLSHHFTHSQNIFHFINFLVAFLFTLFISLIILQNFFFSCKLKV